ncbi:myb family transcription factor [Emericellopsis atlantica]|uniref:Myb family transcription factor n=1 Tax=Emericellopsis atlantica TaxID=2614577 RepID=A0A9P7ZVH9_9HYPO|nr:myb family transcription factor [Emericellopsis atlantica]KAG9258423.1 myb family transcription factor [Emericellopsis atlantica]
MPRGHRTTSSAGHSMGQHPYTLAPSPMYAPRMATPNNTGHFNFSSMPSSDMHLNTQQQPLPNTFDSFQPISSSAPANIPLPASHRPSSGAWTIQDDQNLVAARAQGLNWSQIKDTYFPMKTANACRKRHERLQERRDADDWDNRKLQKLAREYMSMRKEIWSGLAAKTGEKWMVVEQKCMANGLKNLQSAARAGARHERLQQQHAAATSSMTGYDNDDSGVSGISGLTPVDEVDVGSETFSSGSSSSHSPDRRVHHQHAASTSSLPYLQQHQNHHHHRHQYRQVVNAGYGGYGMQGYQGQHRYSSSVSSTASAAQGFGGSEDESPYMPGQRLPSVDMNIEAIINRPNRM